MSEPYVSGIHTSAMMTEPTRAVRDPDLPSRHSRELVAFGQDDALFFEACGGQSRQRRLRTHFAHRKPAKLVIGPNLQSFGFRHPELPVEHLDKGCFNSSDPTRLSRLAEFLDDAVVIINNNDVGHGDGMAGYADLVRHCEKTIFMVWDWDNHHWMTLSTFLAAHSDVYAPAHHENLYLLSRFNPTLAGPVYCSSVQWSRAFLADHLPHILTAERSNEPLGKHIPYAPFGFRNRVVTTLGQYFPSIGFSNRTFHVRTPEDRLAEWTAHKLHWIVPVLNDVPIRIFDALISGGIPVIPESLRHLEPVRHLPRQHVIFYGPQDIVEPHSVVARGIERFDSGGLEGIASRHRLAMDKFHGDHSLLQILAVASEQFDLSS